MGRTWRYTVGDKGVSRVTVFERADATSIYIEWWDNQDAQGNKVPHAVRHKQALSNTLGEPVTDREIAKKLAKLASEGQARHRNQRAAQLLGLPSDHTLGELLAWRHAELAPSWTSKYTKDRERQKAFWLVKLGKDLPLVGLNAAMVERVVNEARGGRGARWVENVLQYLVDSYKYAEEKLKWIEARHNLSAVKVPRPKGTSRAYALSEARALLPVLWKVHPVAGWLGRVVSESGRRIGASRQLTPSDVRIEGQWTFIAFPGATDKARRSGIAVIEDLPPREDWTVPSADLVTDWIHEVETRAGIEHVKGRGWHALKRLYATLTEGMPGADLQAGTRAETLRGHYRQDVMEPKQAVATRVREALKRPGKCPAPGPPRNGPRLKLL